MKETFLTLILAAVFVGSSTLIDAQDDPPRRPDRQAPPDGAGEPRRGAERERGGPPQRGAERERGGPPQRGGERERGGPPQQGSERPRFVPPIIAALDSDKDGLISAEEIASASASLKKLDKNGDGKITIDELRPEGPRGQGGRPSGRPDAREQGGQRPERPEGQRPERPDVRRDGPQRPGPGREAGNEGGGRPQVEGGRGQRPAPGENPTRRRRPQLEKNQ